MQFSRKIKNRLSFLGYYQVIGGVIGIGLTIWLFTTIASFNVFLIGMIIIALLLFTFSICCGALLFRRYEQGIRLSLINQYLQLFSLAIGGYAFRNVSGLYLTVEINLGESFGFYFGVGVSSWKLTFNSGESMLAFGFNFVALIIIIILLKLKSEIRNELQFDFLTDPELPA